MKTKMKMGRPVGSRNVGNESNVDALFDRQDESCYWLGFIAADGSICKRTGGGYGLSIVLSVKDKEHLIKFADFIDYYGNIKNIGNNLVQLVVTLTEEQFFKFHEYNITTRKTHTLKPPSKLKSYKEKACFIVGVIDGDGCFSFSHRDLDYSLSIRGTRELLVWIKEFFDDYFSSVRYAEISFADGYGKWATQGKRAFEIRSVLGKIEVPKLDRKWFG